MTAVPVAPIPPKIGIKWQRQPWVNFLVNAVLIAIMATVGSLGTLTIAYNTLEYPAVGVAFDSIPQAWQWAIASLLGASITIALLWYWRVADAVFDVVIHRHLAKGERLRSVLIFGGIVALVVAFPVTSCVAFRASSAGYRPDWFFKGIVKGASFFDRHAGGTVGFVISVITLSAFTITIQQLRDLRDSIDSFSDLASRIIKLSSCSSCSDPMHIISFTPCIGYLALPRREWAKLSKALIHTDGKAGGECTTRAIVLKEDQLYDWHKEFTGRWTRRAGSVTPELVNEVQAESHKIKSILQGYSVENYIEVDRDSLPGYYCFFNSRKALLVTPFFLPISGQTLEARQSLPNPHMVGYETTDRSTINFLLDQFHYLEANGGSK